jgi:hypothetical protein
VEDDVIDPLPSGTGDEDDHACPLPMAHDRFEEAHWFLHQMLRHYHYPDLFRYSANAFLSAVKSTVEVLRVELQKAHEGDWFKQRMEQIRQDEVLSAFQVGRNIALHQRSIIAGSRVQAGLFRGYKLKLALEIDVRHDAATEDILKFTQQRQIGWILDEEHSAIGEQLGVKRMYFVPELSSVEDVVTASHRAWARLSAVLSDAHARLGSSYRPIPEDDPKAHDVETVALLLESDLDPDAPRRWGWMDDE